MRRAQQLREAKGLSLFDVAKETDIQPTTLSRFETYPNRVMRYPALQRLSAFYGVSIDDLLADVEAPVEAKGT